MHLEANYRDILSGTIRAIRDQIQQDAARLAEAPKKAPRVKSLEVRLEGRESGVLDAFSKFIQSSSRALGSPCPPPSTPPVRFDRWTVLSSPHVHKTARTQFERRTHSRLLTVYNLHDELVPRLIWYLRQHAPPDVRVDAVHHRYVELSHVI